MPGKNQSRNQKTNLQRPFWIIESDETSPFLPPSLPLHPLPPPVGLHHPIMNRALMLSPPKVARLLPPAARWHRRSHRARRQAAPCSHPVSRGQRSRVQFRHNSSNFNVVAVFFLLLLLVWVGFSSIEFRSRPLDGVEHGIISISNLGFSLWNCRSDRSAVTAPEARRPAPRRMHRKRRKRRKRRNPRRN